MNKPVKLGRPSTYTPELGKLICERIAAGSNLSKLDDEGILGRHNVFYWLATIPAFSNAYAKARETRADKRADRIDELCQKVENGLLGANEARVIIDAQKWLMAKEHPREFSDKTINEVVGDAEIKVTIRSTLDPAPVTIDIHKAIDKPKG